MASHHLNRWSMTPDPCWHLFSKLQTPKRGPCILKIPSYLQRFSVQAPASQVMPILLKTTNLVSVDQWQCKPSIQRKLLRKSETYVTLIFCSKISTSCEIYFHSVSQICKYTSLVWNLRPLSWTTPTAPWFTSLHTAAIVIGVCYLNSLLFFSNREGVHIPYCDSPQWVGICSLLQLLLSLILCSSVLEVSLYLGFAGGASDKEPACQCRRHKRHRLDPWVGKIPWRRAWQPMPVFLPGESPWTEEPGRLPSIGSQRVRHT